MQRIDCRPPFGVVGEEEEPVGPVSAEAGPLSPCSRIVPLRYVGSVSAALAHRVQVAFDRCKAFPEAGKQGAYFMVRGEAYLALLELTNLAPEIVLALIRPTE